MSKLQEYIKEIEEFNKIDRKQMLGNCIDERLNDNLFMYAETLTQAVEKTSEMLLTADIFSVMKSINKRK